MMVPPESEPLSRLAAPPWLVRWWRIGQRGKIAAEQLTPSSALGLLPQIRRPAGALRGAVAREIVRPLDSRTADRARNLVRPPLRLVPRGHGAVHRPRVDSQRLLGEARARSLVGVSIMSATMPEYIA